MNKTRDTEKHPDLGLVLFGLVSGYSGRSRFSF